MEAAGDPRGSATFRAMLARHLGVVLLVSLGACSDRGNAAAELFAEARKSRDVLQSLMALDAKETRWQGLAAGAEPCPATVNETTRALVSNVTSVLQSRIGDIDRLLATPPGQLSTETRLQFARQNLTMAQAPVVVFLREKAEAPRATGSGFSPGRLSGSLVLYDIAADRAVCVASVDVVNSATVEFGLSKEEADAISRQKVTLASIRGKAALETGLEADLQNQLAKASKAAQFKRVR